MELGINKDKLLKPVVFIKMISKQSIGNFLNFYKKKLDC